MALDAAVSRSLFSLTAMRASILLLLLPVIANAQAPPLTLTSPNARRSGQFGYSVSGVPDTDGDGQSDLLIGATGEGGGGGDAGRAYLFSGATGALLRTLTSPNPENNGGFGISVSGVADADGDGRGDLLVGAYGESRTYLFSGATGALLRTLTDPNPENNGYFGWSVSGVPDVDGDGDIIVGAKREAGGADYAGRAYLFSGATGALLRSFQSLSPEFEGSFGESVSGVADVNGDGRGDLLIGASNEDGGADHAGRAYLFSGATGALLQSFASPNPEFLGSFGESVSGVADTNGDGRDDLLIGAFGEGRAYLFSGDTGALLRTLTSPNPEEFGAFGISVSGVADIDGDGRGDLLVGARSEDGGAYRSGRAYLFSGATGALLRTLTSPNPEFGARFGNAVAGVPDADDDGRGDLLVGAYIEDGGAEDAGRAYLFPSGSGVTVTTSGSPTTIPPGGTVTVTATVTNTTNQPASLDLWVVAERGGNAVLTRLVGSGTLPAGATVARSFSLTAPVNTPPGPYTVNVRVGDFPNTVYASDAFDVTVTGERVAGALSAESFAVAPVSGDVFAANGFASSLVPDAAPGTASSSASVAVSPNPFAGQTALRFTLAEAGAVQLSVHDVLGREVAVLVDGEVATGPHAVVFDARGLASGVYVWRLASGGSVQTGRLTRLE